MLRKTWQCLGSFYQVVFYANQICNQGTRNALWHDSAGSCSDGLSLRPQRPAAEQKELANKWNEMGTDEPGLQTSPIAVCLLWFSTVDLYVCVRVCERDCRISLSSNWIYHSCVFLSCNQSPEGFLRSLAAVKCSAVVVIPDKIKTVEMMPR